MSQERIIYELSRLSVQVSSEAMARLGDWPPTESIESRRRALAAELSGKPAGPTLSRNSVKREWLQSLLGGAGRALQSFKLR